MNDFLIGAKVRNILHMGMDGGEKLTRWACYAQIGQRTIDSSNGPATLLPPYNNRTIDTKGRGWFSLVVNGGTHNGVTVPAKHR